GLDYAHVPSVGCQLWYSLAHVDYFSSDDVVWFADVSHEALESRARVGDVQHACEGWLELVPVNYDDVDDSHFLLDFFNNAYNSGSLLRNDRGSSGGFHRHYVAVGIDCGYSRLRRVDCSLHLDCSATWHELLDNTKLYSWNNELSIQLLYHGCSGNPSGTGLFRFPDSYTLVLRRDSVALKMKKADHKESENKRRSRLLEESTTRQLQSLSHARTKRKRTGLTVLAKTSRDGTL